MQIKSDIPENAQTFRKLLQEDKERLDKQRSLVEEYLSVGNYNYESVDGKLGLIHDILGRTCFLRDEKYKLQCLGVVFGDALKIKMGLVWQMVKDEDGEDPCLVLEGTSIVIFPLTAISKRIENNQEVNVFELFNSFIGAAIEMKGKGY